MPTDTLPAVLTAAERETVDEIRADPRAEAYEVRKLLAIVDRLASLLAPTAPVNHAPRFTTISPEVARLVACIEAARRDGRQGGQMTGKLGCTGSRCAADGNPNGCTAHYCFSSRRVDTDGNPYPDDGRPAVPPPISGDEAPAARGDEGSES